MWLFPLVHQFAASPNHRPVYINMYVVFHFDELKGHIDS